MDRFRAWVEYDGPVFDDVTTEYGLSGLTMGRVAWGDGDGDGWPDMLLNGSVLFRNENGTAFRDITAEAGVFPGGHGGVFADIDLDGDLDLFVLSHDTTQPAGADTGDTADGTDTETVAAGSGDRLYLNNGSGVFTIVPGGPLADMYPSEGAAWCDIDGDGLPDLYVANYEQAISETGGQRGVGSPDRVYRNHGNAGFDDISDRFAPPGGEALCGRGVSCGDVDNNGRQDIFVSNYRLQRNFLWMNYPHDVLPVFSDEALTRGVAGTDIDGWWGHTIGSAWADCDNDGDLDLFSANLAHPRYIEFSDISQLLINSGPPDFRFSDRTAESGIMFDETHSNPAWADVDNDGDLDLYITSIYENERSYLYLNDGSGLRYTEAGFLSGTRVYNGWGCACADFDRDGDLDVLVGSGSGIRLFRNRGNAHHWLQVAITGFSPIGARVTVIQGNRSQIREIQAGSGTTSQDDGVAHFGFGGDASPVTVRVHLVNGRVFERTNVGIDRRIALGEGFNDIQ
ncbi:CRTAC1 family protein, partial [bacterium]|nr:CRTAC1 family protein [candidate division CSSED10-310 bacterium]